MSEDVRHEAADLMFPAVNNANPSKGRIACIPVTTSSVSQNLATYFPGTWSQGHFFDLLADGGDIYFFFSPNASSDTVNEATTIAADPTVCQKLNNGERLSGRVPDGCQYLYLKGSVGCKLRMNISSRGGRSVANEASANSL